METQIKVLKPHELQELDELISVFEDVFEMENFKKPKADHLQKLMNKETFFAVVARNDEKVVGGLTVYVLDQYYSEKPLAYIFDLVVMTDYQRKGIGKKLIEFTNEFCRSKGFEEVFVQADKVDDYALDFYRKTKPTNEEDVIHFSYNLGNGNTNI